MKFPVLYLLLMALALAGCQDGDRTPVADQPPLTGDCGPLQADRQQALFGDLHVHTSFSFDAYFFNSINGPREAIRFAKGEVAGLPAGDTDPNTPVREVQLDRPLDFVAITDHAEFLGAFKNVCELGGTVPAGTNPACEVVGQSIRNDVRAFIEGRTTPFQIAVQTLLADLPTSNAWMEEKRITDEEYQPCQFTTLHGYEFSSNKRGQMFHRNVIFRGDASRVPDVVFDSVTMTTAVFDENINDDWQLFDHLDAECGGLPGCAVLSIPHNPNLSDGRMFLPRDFVTGVPVGRDGAPMSVADAELRRRYDRVLELYQHKGNAECAVGLAGPYVSGEETGCDFELSKNVCRGRADDPPGCAEVCTGDPASDPAFCWLQFEPVFATSVCETQGPDGGSGPGNNCTVPLDHYRNAMAEGLAIRETLGVNPYRLGIIAGTDNHNGTPGLTTEAGYEGHGGVLEDEPKDHLGSWDCDNSNRAIAPEDPADPDNCTNRVFLDRARAFSGGGLTGVWAPENTRESVWDALHRGETFGTSGPRLQLRMQASWEPPPADVCQQLAQGHQSLPASGGAIMGADLPAPPAGATAPYITVWAIQDPGAEQAGLPLQAIDIVKGDLDATGAPRVREYTAVMATSSAVEPPAPDCSVAPAGHPGQLCVTWQDPDFQPQGGSYWYARAREIPSCRWSTALCVSAGVQCEALDPANGIFPADTGWQGYEGCCAISGEPGSFSGQNIFASIEERVWGSPIWYEPE